MEPRHGPSLEAGGCRGERGRPQGRDLSGFVELEPSHGITRTLVEVDGDDLGPRLWIHNELRRASGRRHEIQGLVGSREVPSGHRDRAQCRLGVARESWDNLSVRQAKRRDVVRDAPRVVLKGHDTIAAKHSLDNASRGKRLRDVLHANPTVRAP